MKLESFTGSKKKKKASLEKETIFFPDSALPLSTENTLFQHNLIYFDFPLASILSNMHCCPDFLVWGGEMQGEERKAVQWGKIQLQNSTP